MDAFELRFECLKLATAVTNSANEAMEVAARFMEFASGIKQERPAPTKPKKRR